MRPHLPAVRRGSAHYSRWQPAARALQRFAIAAALVLQLIDYSEEEGPPGSSAPPRVPGRVIALWDARPESPHAACQVALPIGFQSRSRAPYASPSVRLLDRIASDPRCWRPCSRLVLRRRYWPRVSRPFSVVQAVAQHSPPLWPPWSQEPIARYAPWIGPAERLWPPEQTIRKRFPWAPGRLNHKKGRAISASGIWAV